jgi:hypothetical protein
MSNNKPEDENSAGDGGDKPAAEQHHIAFAIDALKTKYESAQAERGKHEKKSIFWARIAGIGVSIYTVLTVFIMTASIYSAKQSTITENTPAGNASLYGVKFNKKTQGIMDDAKMMYGDNR